MNVDALSRTASNATTATPRKSELDMEQFIRLLTVQLSNQNPLEPMNDRDFFAQMAQLGQVQGLEKLQRSNELEQARNLVGARVSGAMPDGDGAVSGIVRRVTVKNGDTFLGIEKADGTSTELALGSVLSVEPAEDVATGAALIGRSVSGRGYRLDDPKKAMVDVTGVVTAVQRDYAGTLMTVRGTDGEYQVRTRDLSRVSQ